ncbi:MAG: DMP19 family protein [Prevotella sp.]|nr:DMP19 family protein [Prevotella sp.]
MEKVIIKDIELQKASEEGMDAFVDVFVKHTLDLVGGELTAETMPRLSADQITLLGYNILRDEVMNGGYIQLIHNGYGGFIFMNPFARAMKEWGLVELARHIRKVIPLYKKYRDRIEIDCDDDQFMALFEQMPEFDDFDDDFIVNEEQWTAQIAYYLDEHIDQFAIIEK